MINLTENGGKHAALGLQDKVVIAAEKRPRGRFNVKAGQKRRPFPGQNGEYHGPGD
jgi:hypothetical protein